MSERPASEGGESRPRSPSEDLTLIRHDEEASVGKRRTGVGYAKVRRQVEVENARSREPRRREQLTQQRVPAAEDDSGEIETLPDGSISIPLFEEELVITRRTVVRERVIIGKENVTEWQTVEAEIRRERVAFETDDVTAGSVHDDTAVDAVRAR